LVGLTVLFASIAFSVMTLQNARHWTYYVPDAMPIIERMAEQDPNPHIRTVAQDALIWQREFRGWP